MDVDRVTFACEQLEFARLRVRFPIDVKVDSPDNVMIYREILEKEVSTVDHDRSDDDV